MKSTNVTGNSYSIFFSWSKSQNNLRHRRKEYCSERTVHKEQLAPTNDAIQTGAIGYEAVALMSEQGTYTGDRQALQNEVARASSLGDCL